MRRCFYGLVLAVALAGVPSCRLLDKVLPPSPEVVAKQEEVRKLKLQLDEATKARSSDVADLQRKYYEAYEELGRLRSQDVQTKVDKTIPWLEKVVPILTAFFPVAGAGAALVLGGVKSVVSKPKETAANAQSQ